MGHVARADAVAIHPERIAGEPQAVRWVVQTGSVPAGRARQAPGHLGAMLCDGRLSDILVGPAAVWMWLRPGLSWTGLGREVQAALRDALSEPSDWTVDPAPGEVLARVTTDLLDGSVGDFIRSHGGSVVAERSGDEVAVRLGGACEHCPAAEHTLRLRLVGELRRRCPDLVEVDRGDGRLVLRLG
ncbi:MAG: NifU family protein [Mycobacterium sp.]|nr:NifU family protein [Mycobacterium sp.]